MSKEEEDERYRTRSGNSVGMRQAGAEPVYRGSRTWRAELPHQVQMATGTAGQGDNSRGAGLGGPGQLSTGLVPPIDMKGVCRL